MATGYEGLQDTISFGLGGVGCSLETVASAIRENSFYTALISKQLNVLNTNYFKLESQKLYQLKEHMRVIEKTMLNLEKLYKINMFMDIIDKSQNGLITVSDEQQEYINKYISDFVQETVNYYREDEKRRKYKSNFKLEILGLASLIDTSEVKRTIQKEKQNGNPLLSSFHVCE